MSSKQSRGPGFAEEGPESATTSSAGKRSLTQGMVQRKASPAADGASTVAVADASASPAVASPTVTTLDPFSAHLPVQRQATAGRPGATAAAPDDNEKELKEKVGALVRGRYGNDYRKAFDHYDTDNDGAVSKDELKKLLADAGVGSGLTRGAWASGVIDKMDKGNDGKIQWAEFEAATR